MAEGRERLELLCFPPSSQAGEEEWGRPLPAWSSWHLPGLGTSLVGQGVLASPKRDPGEFPCPVLSWDSRVPEQL